MDAVDLFLADGNSTLVAVLVFLAAGTLAFSVMAVIRVQGAVRRRAATISRGDFNAPPGARSLRHSSAKAAQRVIDYTSKHYSTGNSEEAKVLRRRLIQAGIYDQQAVAYFFLGRTGLAVGLAILAFFFLPIEQGTTPYWLLIVAAGVAGYLAPSLYIDNRIKKRKAEHQSGFPDFMDLLVVCADAGLSMEASLDRVGRELGDSYPSLTANIHMACLEIRAGRTMSEALEHLGDRLGIEEARSFSTLIQQSEELGSSITDALRVYSDDMRHKRLSRAEEKAYSLPAKLAVPMMLCIFPVLFVVILLPVFVKLYLGNY
ncbi:type II secretion system F family protein [Rhodoplanes sp. Z2-YC6860]|uniref:type II secretion system F family protein n=1 Tax=Rhodoplanes sp. Z2-YC6860 TaxID=674703 RepID=UPI00078CB014|nr:type II secretion system F family protein [Rhodoplanes sp. Z2-YC6860]AMN38866.1 Flp pilus assembly protein TadC [Rhodoplanes sp. Z2-YC6860]